MDQQVDQFLQKNRVCSLTTLRKDGSPHAAAMHFSSNENPFELYLQTERPSIKVEALLDGQSGRASIVVGLSEEEWATLQMDGEIAIVGDKSELNKIYDIHYQKHPKAKQYRDLKDTIFLKFTPTWWRYTEFKPEMKIISSEE
mgnify:FL=1